MLEIASPIISGIAALISFLIWKDRRVETAKKEIDDLTDKVTALEIRVSVLDERIANEIKILDKLGVKIDQIESEL